MKTKTSTWETGRVIRLKVMEHFTIIREWFIQESGRMMKCMVKAKKSGLMAQFS